MNDSFLPPNSSADSSAEPSRTRASRSERPADPTPSLELSPNQARLLFHPKNELWSHTLWKQLIKAGIWLLAVLLMLASFLVAFRFAQQWFEELYFMPGTNMEEQQSDTWFESAPEDFVPLEINPDDHIALLRLEGVIGFDIHRKDIINFFRTVLRSPNIKALILFANSPGGSSADSEKIAQTLQRMKQLRPELKVYAFIEETASGGGYWIASGADQVIARSGAVLGSIGVGINRFNYAKLYETIGIEDTTIKKGKYKYGAPTKPENPVIDAYLKKELVEPRYQDFIHYVLSHRGSRINPKTPKSLLFSGGLFDANQALRYGLIDKIEPFEVLLADIRHELQNPSAKHPKPSQTKGSSPTKSSSASNTQATKDGSKEDSPKLALVEYSFKPQRPGEMYEILFGDPPILASFSDPVLSLNLDMLPPSKPGLLRRLLSF